VKAEIYNLESLSAHGDYNEILQQLEAGDVMQKRVRERFG
jgi:metallo-beta-lactamase family protein